MSDAPTTNNPQPVGIGLTLPYASPAEFLERGCGCLTAGGIYLRAPAHPVGTQVFVELRCRSGERLLRFLGAVAFTTGDGGQGHPGMGIRFVQLDAPSVEFVQRACTGRPGADAPQPPLPPGVGPAHGGEAAPPPATIFSRSAATLYPSAPQQAPAAPAQPASPSPAAPSSAAATSPAAGPAKPQEQVLYQADPATRQSGPRLAAVPKVSAPQGGPIDNPLLKVKPIAGVPSGPIIGIDLGTTFSCAACVKGGRPYVIPSREGSNTIPSVVAVNNKHKLLVGHRALAQMIISPHDTIYGGKRLVGRPITSPVIDQVKARFHYEIVEGPKGEAAVKMGGQLWSLQEISALILLEAKELAIQHLGTNVERAVITVPAYYNDNQRQAVRQAGALAGLHVERIINEPTAAALAFGWGRQLKKTVLVYDLGGGTFDVSLLRLSDTVYEVISTGGDTFLGGVDFDMQIVDHLMMEFQVKSGRPFAGDPIAKQRMLEAAERAKRLLSEQAETRIQLPFLQMVDGEPFGLDVTLTRAQLNELTARLVDRTIEVCKEVLAAQKMSTTDVEEILFVGGMSRMPQVFEKVQAFFGKAPVRGVHPDEAVGIGAALFAHSLGQEQGVVLIDVLPMSIGVGIPGGRFKKIIERNTALPHTREFLISTVRDDQEKLDLVVYQGDGDRLDQCEYLGSVTLAPLPKGPRGSIKVAVSFSLSAECLLTLTAKELSRGMLVQTTLTTLDTPATIRSKVEQGTEQAGAGGQAPAGATALAGEGPVAPLRYRKSWFEKLLDKLFPKRRRPEGPAGDGGGDKKARPQA